MLANDGSVMISLNRTLVVPDAWYARSEFILMHSALYHYKCTKERRKTAPAIHGGKKDLHFKV